MRLVSVRIVVISIALIEVLTGAALAESRNDIRPDLADKLNRRFERRGGALVVSEQPVAAKALKLSVEREAIVQKVCRKYNHCAAGKSTYGIPHLVQLDQHLKRLMIQKYAKNSNENSLARDPEIETIRADLNSLYPLSKIPSNGLGPRDPWSKVSEEKSFILGICSNYKHCSSKISDELHCYQLESLLLKLKAEKAVLVQTPEIKREIRYLDSDLLKLKDFGTMRPSSNRAEPYERFEFLQPPD
jgi:hypothetical protein